MSQTAESLKLLWTDRPDAASLLEQKFASGLLTPAERDDIAHFIEHGWLLWLHSQRHHFRPC